MTTAEALRIEIPVRTHNPLNGSHQHWSVKARRRKAERTLMATYLHGRKLPPLPVMVKLTRFGRGTLDDDGLPASFKSIRDAIATAYGVDDGPKSPIRFAYDQTRAKAYAVRVEISSRA